MSDQPQGQIPTVAFGTTPEMKSHLAELVATGVKRATTSVRAAYQAEGEPLPAADELATAGDGAGQAVCTIAPPMSRSDATPTSTKPMPAPRARVPAP